MDNGVHTRHLRTDLAAQLIGAFDDEFGGRGRCRRTQISDKVRNGVIDLMAYGGNDRDLGRGNSARHPFFVKGPEILNRATPAPDDEHIEGGTKRIQGGNGLGDFFCGPLALHTHRIQVKMNVGKTPVHHMDDIADGRAGRRRDNPEAPRHHGNGPFARFVKEPLTEQTIFELFEGQL